MPSTLRADDAERVQAMLEQPRQHVPTYAELLAAAQQAERAFKRISEDCHTSPLRAIVLGYDPETWLLRMVERSAAEADAALAALHAAGIREESEHA